MTSDVLPPHSVVPGPMVLACCPVEGLMLGSSLPPRHSASGFSLQFSMESLMPLIQLPVPRLVLGVNGVMESGMFGGELLVQRVVRIWPCIGSAHISPAEIPSLIISADAKRDPSLRCGYPRAY